MIKYATLLLALSISLMLPAYAFAEEPDTYLIHASEEQLEQITAQFNTVLKEYDEVPLVELKLTKEEKTSLKEQFSTAEIYPNRIYETTADIVSPSFTTTKSSPTLAAPYTGQGIRVAVLDTGIDTNHSDLAVAGGVCTADDCAAKIPYDDNFGHGTHVAGIIAAKKNNAGIIGIAPNVKLFAIKAMDSQGAGTTAQVTKGVEWAIKNKIDILNLSLSISEHDRPLELMLQEAGKKGMLIVAAAGNEGGDGGTNTVTYPGKYSPVIAVSALTNDLKKEKHSSMGPEVELAAPGADIFSTFPRELDNADYVVDGYQNLTGTSMAAPHVTGILALYKEQHPAMSHTKLREILRSTAKDLGTAGRDISFGYGLVQYEKEIKTMPLVETKVVKGKVSLTLKNKELASNWTIKEGTATLPEKEPGKWILYKTKGTYPLTFSYTDKNGAKKNEVLSIKVTEPAFPDVTMAVWYAPHISYLYSNNFMSGYLDGSFKPNREIKRGEAMILLGRAQGFNGASRTTKFTDVGANHSAAGYIQSAYEKGIIQGYPDGSFRPDQSVTRAEMALLIQSVFQFKFDPALAPPFIDVKPEQASYKAIQAITQNKITSGYSATTFAPDKMMNRYAFSVFLARAKNPSFIK